MADDEVFATNFESKAERDPNWELRVMPTRKKDPDYYKAYEIMNVV